MFGKGRLASLVTKLIFGLLSRLHERGRLITPKNTGVKSNFGGKIGEPLILCSVIKNVVYWFRGKVVWYTSFFNNFFPEHYQ